MTRTVTEWLASISHFIHDLQCYVTDILANIEFLCDKYNAKYSIANSLSCSFFSLDPAGEAFITALFFTQIKQKQPK